MAKVQGPRVILAECFAKLHNIRNAKDVASVSSALKTAVPVDPKNLPSSIAGLESYLSSGVAKASQPWVPKNSWLVSEGGNIKTTIRVFIELYEKAPLNMKYFGYSVVLAFALLGYPTFSARNNPESEYVMMRDDPEKWKKHILAKAIRENG